MEQKARKKRVAFSKSKNVRTQAFRDFWAHREELRCEGKSTVCDRGVTNHEKHLAKNLPAGYDDPCTVKQCHSRHLQDRNPENMGLADPHYVAEKTLTVRHPTIKGETETCCHGDDYDSDSDDDDDDMYVNKATRWVSMHAVQMKYYIPVLGAMFTLWLFVMNYAIYGKGPALTDR